MFTIASVLLNTHKFDFKDKGRVSRNNPSHCLIPIRKVRWDNEKALATHFHTCDSLVPSFNHLSST